MQARELPLLGRRLPRELPRTDSSWRAPAALLAMAVIAALVAVALVAVVSTALALAVAVASMALQALAVAVASIAVAPLSDRAAAAKGLPAHRRDSRR